MIEKTVRSVTDLVDFLHALSRRWPDGLWYRGHAKANWKLLPKAYRDRKMKKAEAQMYHRFHRGAPSRYANCPPSGEGGEWLPLMQHYGLPTRLLDWTASPLIALYFAVNYERDKRKGPASVWVLNPTKMNDEFIGIPAIVSHTDNDCVESIIQNITNPKCVKGNDKVVAIFTREIDVRIAVQQGRFTIHGLQAPLEDTANACRFLAKITIAEKARNVMRDFVDLMGMQLSMLFPDLDHLAEGIARDYR